LFFKKNIFVFITSVVMAIVFIFFAAVITSYQSGFIEEKFSLSEDGSFIIMGKSYKPDKVFLQSVQKYLSVCENVNSAFFPDIITLSLKKTAASLKDAAIGLFNCFGKIFSEITRGNM